MKALAKATPLCGLSPKKSSTVRFTHECDKFALTNFAPHSGQVHVLELSFRDETTGAALGLISATRVSELDTVRVHDLKRADICRRAFGDSFAVRNQIAGPIFDAIRVA